MWPQGGAIFGTRATTNINVIRQRVSDTKISYNFPNRFLYFTCVLTGRAHFQSQCPNLNKIGRGVLGDAKYQNCKVLGLVVSNKKIYSMFSQYQSKEEGKDQELIESSTTHGPRHHFGKWQNIRKHQTRESKAFSPFPAGNHKPV